jgi:DNA processing protein
MAEYNEAVYWLTLINESGLKLNRLKPIAQEWCVHEARTLSDAFGLSPLEWMTTFGLSDTEADQIAAAGDKLPRQAEALARWQARGLQLLLRTDSQYPQRFITTLPPAMQPLLLWAQGNLDLLNEPGVALLGQEASTETTTRLIHELVGALAGEKVNLISGYGRGLERTAFEAMLAIEGGRSVALLPMGLSAFTQTTTRLNAPVAARQTLLVSPFAPDTAYHEKLAEARNLLVDHLALALLLPQGDSTTQERAMAALGRGLPVFVEEADRALLDQGALPLTDTGELFELLEQMMIDTALLEQSQSLPPPPAHHQGDDYSLGAEAVEPLDTDEALAILSIGGSIPPVLQQRLKSRQQRGE